MSANNNSFRSTFKSTLLQKYTRTKLTNDALLQVLVVAVVAYLLEQKRMELFKRFEIF